MEEIKHQVKDVLKASEPMSRTFIQKFQFLKHSVVHQNLLEVEVQEQKEPELSIRNYIATANDTYIIKVTQILLDDKIVKIIDTFNIQSPTNQGMSTKGEHLSHEAPRIVHSDRHIVERKTKRNKNMNGNQQYHIRDIKNVVKNIVRLFQNWVEDSPSRLQLSTSLTSLVNGHGKFNNNLIRSISKQSQLREAFIAFGRNSGESAIAQSKINDKNSHLQALNKYLQICSEEVAPLQNHLKEAQIANNQDVIVNNESSDVEKMQYEVKVEQE